MWGREGDLMRPVKTVQLTALMGGWREGRLAEGGARPRGRRCPGRGMELVRCVGNGLPSAGEARPRGRRCRVEPGLMMQRRLRPPGRGMELVRYVVTVGNSLPSAAVAGATRRALARTRSQRGRMSHGPQAVCTMMAVTDGYNVLEWAGGVAGELGFEGDGVACGRKGGGHMVGERVVQGVRHG